MALGAQAGDVVRLLLRRATVVTVAGVGLGVGFALAYQFAQAAAPVAPPPPPTAAVVWHVTANGQSHGPYNQQQLIQGIQQGHINGQTLVWCAGMAGWTAAGQVKELAGYFAAPPPPPPPPPQS
jgi:hypothetical protein